MDKWNLIHLASLKDHSSYILITLYNVAALTSAIQKYFEIIFKYKISCLK